VILNNLNASSVVLITEINLNILKREDQLVIWNPFVYNAVKEFVMIVVLDVIDVE
jgi:hypothetical protein